MRRSVIPVMCCVLFLAGSARAEEASLGGLVTFQGQPVMAKVTLHLPNGQFVGCLGDKEGKFAIDHLQPGVYKVTIEGKQLPPKYAFADQTSLTVEVKPGKGTVAFELK
ncbi:carboxypeptidase-like regulatory domain-containing protein [Zavarzinella formosa]|uniref:carboxypeptidase-like regulatory domain-containing protein n=1 Tax=Zavarzinella formosa TaxID=360055 RepID=UPI0002D68823|nr:carboxypeptidase-like regulatory domain-containing protein [Zavarzinella formosa]